MSSRTYQLDDGMLDAVRSWGGAEPGAFQRVREEAGSHPQGEMQICQEQGQLFRVLMRAVGARRIAEVGTFTGYSSMIFAEGVGSDGHVVSIDHDPDVQAIASRNAEDAGLGERIQFRCGDGVGELERLRDEVLAGDVGIFDVVFLDADKARMARYVEVAFGVVRPGGLILVDNVFNDGRLVSDPDGERATAMRQVSAWLKDRGAVRCLVPIADGLGMVVRP